MSFLKVFGNFLSKAYGFGKKAIHGARSFGSKASDFINSDSARNMVKGFDTLADMTGYGKYKIGKYHQYAKNLIGTGNTYLGRADNILDSVKGAIRQKREDNMERRQKKSNQDKKKIIWKVYLL